MVGPRKRVYVDNQDITVGDTSGGGGDDGSGGTTNDNTLWFRSVDLSLINFELLKTDGRITDINTQYDELEAEYDAQYGQGTGVVTDYDRTVITEDLNPIDFESHNTTHTRDGNGRVTEMEIDLASETVTYSFTWDQDDNLTDFTRTVN